MASVNVSEKDFEAVAHAAMDAYDKGDLRAAEVLDKLARKINAALSNSHIPGPFGKQTKPLTWEDIPSVLYKKGKDGPPVL